MKVLPPQEVSDEEVREFQRGCVAVNHLFLALSEQGIMEYRDHWPKRTPRENIDWVGRDKTCRRKFRRILEGLHNSLPMHEQAAYLLRAFSGLQMFPDANHRTGLIVVAFYLDAQGWRFSSSSTEMVQLVERIRPLYGALSARRTVDRIGERDGSFQHISAFMQQHVRRLTLKERVRRRLRRRDHLGMVVRGLPLQDLHAPESPQDERRRKARP